MVLLGLRTFSRHGYNKLLISSSNSIILERTDECPRAVNILNFCFKGGQPFFTSWVLWPCGELVIDVLLSK